MKGKSRKSHKTNIQTLPFVYFLHNFVTGTFNKIIGLGSCY